MVGSEGRWGWCSKPAQTGAVCPKGQGGDGDRIRTSAESLSAARDLDHKPSAVEVEDKSILDNTRQNAGRMAFAKSCDWNFPRTLCVESMPTGRKICRRGCRRSNADLRERKLGYHYHVETTCLRKTRIWSLREAALGLSMAMKDDANPSPSWKTPRCLPKAERVHRAVSGLGARPRDDSRSYATRRSCLHVRPG